MINISREGLSFNYFGDRLLRRWPWRSGDRYSSSIHACDFNSLRDYWWHVGALEARLLQSDASRNVSGMHMYEVLADYCKLRYPHSTVVVLYDIDCTKKDGTFWSRLPAKRAVEFSKDVVCLVCKDRDQMLSVMGNIPVAFATAIAVDSGAMIDCNQWRD